MTRPANREDVAPIDAVTGIDQLMGQTFAFEAKFINWLLIMRPLGSPRVSTVVAESGKYSGNPLHRHRRIARTVYLAGRRAAEGKPSQLVDSMNEAHRGAAIPEVDLRYVLSIFVAALRRAVDRHAWRPLTESEVNCVVAFYRGAGTRMGLADLPTDYAGFAEILDSYESEHQIYHAANHRLAALELDLIGGRRRGPARWLIRQAHVSLMDDSLRTALGIAEPAIFVRTGVRLGLALRSHVRRRSARLS